MLVAFLLRETATTDAFSLTPPSKYRVVGLFERQDPNELIQANDASESGVFSVENEKEDVLEPIDAIFDGVSTTSANTENATSSIINGEKSTKNDKDDDPEASKINLMWCGDDSCFDDLRERVVGTHNQIQYTGPATGQVAYYYTEKQKTKCVLILVKKNTIDLLQIAAKAVQNLTAVDSNIQILLEDSVASRLKHFYNVDSPQIHLFEAQEFPGFGPNPKISADNDVLPVSQGKFVPDLIVTLGGDGLLMHTGMLFQGPVPPILCVSGGSLGFLTAFAPSEMVEAVQIALGLIQAPDTRELQVFPPNMPYEDKANKVFGLGGNICLSIRMRLDCRIVTRGGTVRARYNVLNEVAIDRGSSAYLAALECFCDDVHLTTVQADGVIFATPTGSTAYSLAAGSSVVHPAVPAILVTPICPHVLSFRSMVFPDHVVLRCYVPEDARSEASVSFDGKHRQVLRRGDSVQIQMSCYPVPTINRKDHSSDWLDSLKRNFNFNARPRQKPL